MQTSTFCLCGSGIEYAHCCGPFHCGDKKPVTALALMRSRYTAYALRNADYVLETWDVAVRPPAIDFFGENIVWQRLEICTAKKGGAQDTKGLVEFKAYYLQDGELCVMHEISRFSRRAGDWFYLDGRVKFMGQANPPTHPGKNAPCACGSGKKFKRCCGVR